MSSLIGRFAVNQEETLQRLNTAYQPLDFKQRIEKLYTDFDVDKVLVTSSFAATSAYFLHIISNINPDQVVSFIDTGYHFPETVEYRKRLTEQYNLKVQALTPDEYQHQYSQTEKLYETDSDFCCTINKVNPLEEVKENYDVWVSSLMGWQSDHRAGLSIFEQTRNILKFNPMIDVSKEQRDAYIREFNLPFHPLVEKGYMSIGCTHCTVPGEGRSGRWVGKPKTECGLHL